MGGGEESGHPAGWDVRTDRLHPDRTEDASLDAWVARLATDAAARSRLVGRSLTRQAAAEGTFAGTLADLAERGRPVLVHLHNGRLHRGAITSVGADYLVLDAGPGRPVVISQRAVASVRTPPGEAATTGDRPVPTTGTLAELVSTLLDERPRLAIVGLDARQVLSGRLQSVGRDVLAVRLDGGGGTAYVALDSVSEMSVVESG